MTQDSAQLSARAQEDYRSLPSLPLIELLRPKHWVKNVLVFAALVFGQQLFNGEALARAWLAFVSMCLAASTVYVFNDLRDIAADRLHPLKRNRPLASGRVRESTARIVAAILAAASCVLAFTLSPAAGCSIALYIVLNVFYTIVGKHIVILDVMLLAFFYVLRVLLGAFAVDVAPSTWLILCTLNVSLFLAIGKRRAELVALELAAASHRRVLEHYSLSFIDQMIGIVTSATLVCYILYTLDSRTVSMFETDLLILTVPFVIYGLFRYLYLLFHRGQGDSPTTTILLDTAFILNGVLWAASCVLVIYGHEPLDRWIRFD